MLRNEASLTVTLDPSCLRMTKHRRFIFKTNIMRKIICKKPIPLAVMLRNEASWIILFIFPMKQISWRPFAK